MTLVEAMQLLYKHEINFKIYSCWDGGVCVCLLNGMMEDDHATEAYFAIEDIDKAGDYLIKQAKLGDGE